MRRAWRTRDVVASPSRYPRPTPSVREITTHRRRRSGSPDTYPGSSSGEAPDPPGRENRGGTRGAFRDPERHGLARGHDEFRNRSAFMNALLLYPELPDTFWSFKHALSFVGKRASLPPLGLLTVAAMLPPDWQSRLVDLNVRGLRSADLAWADLVFLSAMIVQRDAAREIIDQCRQARVSGGRRRPAVHYRARALRGRRPLRPRRGRDHASPLPGRLSRGRPRSIYRAGAFAELAGLSGPPGS